MTDNDLIRSADPPTRLLLVLQVISENGTGLGASRRKIFDATGGRIGRAPDCDWTLVSPYISRHHATISYEGGCFYIESVGPIGVRLNAAPTSLLPRQRYPLVDGDRLLIEEFEISVVVDGGNAGRPELQNPGHFGLLGDPAASHPGERAALIQDQSWGHSDANPTPEGSPSPGDRLVPKEWDATPFGHPARVPRAPPTSFAPSPPTAAARADPLAPPDATILGPRSPRRIAPDHAWGPDSPTTPARGSRVHMTVFSPSAVVRQRDFFLQAVFHRPGAEQEARERAALVERDPVVAQRLPLPDVLQKGQHIRIRLTLDKRIRADETDQTLQWMGDTVAAQFRIRLPWFDWRREYLITTHVDIDGCPVGRCKLLLRVLSARRARDASKSQWPMSSYSRAFVSYASEDSAAISHLAQLLEIQGIPCFVDKLSLRPGDEWKKSLKEQIENADLFLLCWSKHAAKSEWVGKEIEFALRSQVRHRGERPDIRPVILDGPPTVPPPDSLKHLHFDSPARFLSQPLNHAS